MSTARDLISGSLRLIGVLASGETASANEQNDALLALNDMLDSFSLENLMIPSKATEDFPLVIGQSSYTMGPAGNFNTSRPLGLDGAAIVSSNSEFPMNILSIDEWQAIQLKTTTSTIPLKLYPVETFPLYTINVWPVPSAVNTLRIYSWKQLANLATASTAVSLPPGYNQALKYALAIILSPEYGKPVDPTVAAVAQKSLAAIKRANIKPRMLGTDAGVTHSRRFNVYRGD